MKKISILVLTIAIIVGMTGCSSAPSETVTTTASSGSSSGSRQQDNNQLDPIVQSGFSQNDYGVIIGVVVENPNVDKEIKDCALSITVKNSQGDVIGADPDFKFGTLLPAETFGFGLSIQVADGIEASTVDVSVKNKGISANNSGIIVAATEPNKGALTNYLGEIENNSDKELSTVMAGVVVYNEDGEIIGGGYDDLYSVEPGVIPYDVHTFVDDAASAKAWAHVYHE